MVRSCLALTLFAFLVLAPATTHATTQSDSGLVQFITPSKQIGCAYLVADRQIRCDALFLNDTGFLLSRTGKGRKIKITDTIFDPDARVLAYGKSFKRAPFTCTSRRTGLTCERGKSGHGFFISRERQRVY